MSGLPTNRTVNGFAVNPEDPKKMYVATRDGLFQSTDAGTTWKALGQGLKDLAAVILNPKRPGEIYVATTEGVIFRSNDGGNTWRSQQD